MSLITAVVMTVSRIPTPCALKKNYHSMSSTTLSRKSRGKYFAELNNIFWPYMNATSLRGKSNLNLCPSLPPPLVSGLF